MKPWLAWFVALVAVIGAVMVIGRMNRTPPYVSATAVRESDIRGSFTAEGVVKSKEYNLSPEMAGRIASISVKEGDPVHAGQALLVLDSAQAMGAVRQAQSAIQTAESTVREARAGYSLARDQIESRINSASARIREAEARLQRVKQGARRQEIEVAEHRLEQLEATDTAARKDYDRASALFKEGAVARATLDAAEARYRAADSDVEAQKDAIALLKSGATRPEIREAQSAIDSAQVDHKGAVRGRDELKGRLEAIASASSRVAEARAALSQAETVIPKLTLRAPVDGVVVRVNSETGMMASPATFVITLGTRQDIRIEAEISSEDAAKAKRGMPVTVTSAAWPGQRFPAQIKSLSESGELKPDAAIRTRIIRARISLDEGFARFKPGVEVDVEGEAILKQALVVPSDALVYEGTKTSVWVLDGGIVTRREVKVGFATAEITEVVSGLKAGAQVVTKGKEVLKDGEAVRVRP